MTRVFSCKKKLIRMMAPGNRNTFRNNGPCEGIHRSPTNTSHKGPVMWTFDVLFVASCWTNSQVTGDLWHHDLQWIFCPCPQVETIGDAYMIVSGLPRRNGPQHIRHMANCALDLLSGVLDFKVPHLPEHKLRIRIGWYHLWRICGRFNIWDLPSNL